MSHLGKRGLRTRCSSIPFITNSAIDNVIIRLKKDEPYGYERDNDGEKEKESILELHSDLYYQQYCDFVVKCFQSWKIVTTQESIVKTITFADSRYQGKNFHLLPDIIVNWKNIVPVDTLESNILGTMTTELTTESSGNHFRSDGFTIVNNLASANLNQLNDIEDFAGFVKDTVSHDSIMAQL